MKSVRILCLLVVEVALTLGAMAQSFFVEGLEFEVVHNSSSEARMVRFNRCMKEYAVPAQVDYNGRNFRVTQLGNNTFRKLTCVENLNLSLVQSSVDGYVHVYEDNGSQDVFGAFAYCYELRQLQAPYLEKVGDYTFYACRQLQQLSLPQVVTLGQGAFLDAKGLLDISLGEKTATIMARCFEGADHIERIKVAAKRPPLCDTSSFSDIVYQNAVLQVPVGQSAAYRQADGWRNFQHIEEVVADGISEEKIANRLFVYHQGHQIKISGVPQGSVFQLFDACGRLCHQERSVGQDIFFESIPNGCYIGRVGNTSFKLLLNNGNRMSIVKW